MPTSHALLGVLASQGERHGYELKREYDQRLPGVRPLAFGQLYTTLARLVRTGLIAEAGHQRAGGPERVAYRLTDEGRDELNTWLRQVVEPSPHVSSELFLKVIVALLATSDESVARAYLDAQRAKHLEHMRVLTEVKTAGRASIAEVTAADYLLTHLDADVRWMATTLTRIAQIRMEVIA